MTVKALIRKINRKLVDEGERMRTLPGGHKDENTLGNFYVVNDQNCVVASHVDPEQWGRELGALKVGERVL